MAFETTYKMSESDGLKRRMVAAAASAGRADAKMWVEQNWFGMVPLMVTPLDTENNSQAWWTVWEYAEAGQASIGSNADIGGRTDVILDAWISQVVNTYIQNTTPE